MQKKSSTKNIIIIVAVLAVAGLAYFYFSGTPQDASSQLVSDAPPSPVTDEATKILTLLNQTSSLRINTTLFTSPVYKSLVDHTVPVIEQAVGKPNPFFYSLPPAPPASKTK